MEKNNIKNFIEFLKEDETLNGFKTVLNSDIDTIVLNVDLGQAVQIKSILEHYKAYLKTFSDCFVFEFMKKQNYYEKNQCSIIMDFLNRIVDIYSQNDNLYTLFELERVKFNLIFNSYSEVIQITCNSFINWGTDCYPWSTPFYEKIIDFQANNLVETVNHNLQFLKQNILDLLSWSISEEEKNKNINISDRLIIQVLDSDIHLDGWFIQYTEI